MRSTRLLGLAGALILVTALAGCGGTGPPGRPTTGQSPVASSESPGASEPVTTSAELTVRQTPFGEIVVDKDGMTAYMYDEDLPHSTSSACTGECAAAWPAITTPGVPTVEGITGAVGTIALADGRKQITLNGLPLYTFAQDGTPGDVLGQAFDNKWWVAAPSGQKVTNVGTTSGN